MVVGLRTKTRRPPGNPLYAPTSVANHSPMVVRMHPSPEATRMPTPFMMGEGPHVDHFGNLTGPYVDFRPPSERLLITRLVKAAARNTRLKPARLS